MLILTLVLLLVIASLITYAFNKPVGFIAMQITLAIAAVYGVYVLSLWVLKRDKLVMDQKYNYDGNTKTLIIAGFADTHAIQRTVIDTLNPSSLSFAAIPRSINRNGGAQFTYQFWLLLTNPTNVTYQDILVKGDNMAYNLMTVDESTKEVLSHREDIMIKCPRIKFNGKYNELAVEVNTIEDPNPTPFIITSTPNSADPQDNSMRKNLFKLGINRWLMYTFVFRDRVPLNEFENGIEMRFFCNDVHYQSSTMKSALRQNNGNLYLFPTGAIDGCKIGNLAYYNYALTIDEIEKVYNAGPPTVIAATTDTGATASPLFLTEYNKLNIYNS